MKSIVFVIERCLLHCMLWEATKCSGTSYYASSLLRCSGGIFDVITCCVNSSCVRLFVCSSLCDVRNVGITYKYVWYLMKVRELYIVAMICQR